MVHQKKRRLPPWILGLLFAVIIFALALFLLDVFGYGDDPVIGEGASAMMTALH